MPQPRINPTGQQQRLGRLRVEPLGCSELRERRGERALLGKRLRKYDLRLGQTRLLRNQGLQHGDCAVGLTRKQQRARLQDSALGFRQSNRMVIKRLKQRGCRAVCQPDPRLQHLDPWPLSAGTARVVERGLRSVGTGRIERQPREQQPSLGVLRLLEDDGV